MAFGAFHDTLFHHGWVLDEIILLLKFLADLVEIGVVPTQFLFLDLIHNLIDIVCIEVFHHNLIQHGPNLLLILGKGPEEPDQPITILFFLEKH